MRLTVCLLHLPLSCLYTMTQAYRQRERALYSGSGWYKIRFKGAHKIYREIGRYRYWIIEKLLAFYQNTPIDVPVE